MVGEVRLLDPLAQPGQGLRFAERAELIDVQLHPPVVLHLDGDLRRRPASSRRSASCFHPASRPLTSSARCSWTGMSRLRAAGTSASTASQSGPSSRRSA